MPVDLQPVRPCPVCGSQAQGALHVAQRIQEGGLSAASFASRKEPEFFSWEMRVCPSCRVVYAPRLPAASMIEEGYAQASFDTAQEAVYAAQTYADALFRDGSLSKTGSALEVGAGTGALLPLLAQGGFHPVWGVEPSASAIAAADERARPFLVEGFFPSEVVPPGPHALVACFMTIEHLPDPMGFCRAAFEKLAPGGTIALVSHDYTAPLNRLLGRRSPIIDIEHFQLFCPQALERLLKGAGFEQPRFVPLVNRYPLRYWLRLMPLPAAVKRAVARCAAGLGMADWAVSLPVGNVMTLARKPMP